MLRFSSASTLGGRSPNQREHSLTEWGSIQYRDEGRLLAGAADPERTYIETILPVKLAFYQRHVEQRSFWMDLRIIAGTLNPLWHQVIRHVAACKVPAPVVRGHLQTSVSSMIRSMQPR